MARLVRFPLFRWAMLLAIRIVVPRHRIGVALVALDENDRVLMLRHVFHPGTPWGLPGGWLQRNEDPAEGVLRELKEETGLTADLGPVVRVTGERVPPHVGIAFMARIQPGSMKISSEILEAAWFSPDALPGPLLPFVREAIEACQMSTYKRVEE